MTRSIKGIFYLIPAIATVVLGVVIGLMIAFHTQWVQNAAAGGGNISAPFAQWLMEDSIFQGAKGDGEELQFDSFESDVFSQFALTRDAAKAACQNVESELNANFNDFHEEMNSRLAGLEQACGAKK